MKKDKKTLTTSLPKKLKLSLLSTEDYESTASNINNKNEILLTIHRPYPQWYIYSNGKLTLIPIKSGNLCYASCINDHSEVVGYFGPEFDRMTAYYFKDGKMTILPTLGGSTCAGSINNDGLIVGYSTNKDGRLCAVVWEKGKIINLGPKFPGASFLSDVNKDGTCVGSFEEKNKPYAPFLYKDGSIKVIRNQIKCLGSAINNHNYVVGDLFKESTNMAFLYKNNQFSSPGIKGERFSTVSDINDNNIITGRYIDKARDAYGFLWKDGKVININSIIKSEYIVTSATSINNKNYIVGQCTGKRKSCACLLIPEE